MEGTKLPSHHLQSHEFVRTTNEEVRDHVALRKLLLRIGAAPLTFARSGTLGLGYTLARDELGRLWWNDGQYDLQYYRFIDCTPSRELVYPNRKAA